ncbi:MAG: hypothetical protein FJ144_19910 [Deltaproteobacteria bacterium]|nr:hypothetical protein [Deltaproteobacteria bacterium]
MSRRLIAIVACTMVLAGTTGFAADPVKVGPEIVVDDEYARDTPRVASDAAGNFIVAWESDYDAAKARRWFATGAEFVPEFQVSSPTQYLGTGGSTSTGNLGVAGDSAGNFMVTFNAFDYAYDPEGESICGEPCLFTRRSDANGLIGPTFTIQDPKTTYVYEFFYGDQVSNPEAANLANGDFVVVWEGYDKYPIPDDPGEFGSDESAFAAKTTATGQRKGSYFRVNTIAEAYQGQYGDFSADGDDSGNFVVAFRSEYDYYFPGGTLHAQRFDANGHKVGPEFGVSSEDVDGRLVDLAQAPDGTWMVTWRDSGDVTGRIFNGDGTPVTDDFTVALGGGYASYPAIASSDDSFVVVWEDDGTILGQRFDLAGNELTTEFEVSTDPDAYLPDVASRRTAISSRSGRTTTASRERSGSSRRRPSSRRSASSGRTSRSRTSSRTTPRRTRSRGVRVGRTSSCRRVARRAIRAATATRRGPSRRPSSSRARRAVTAPASFRCRARTGSRSAVPHRIRSLRAPTSTSTASSTTARAPRS